MNVKTGMKKYIANRNNNPDNNHHTWRYKQIKIRSHVLHASPESPMERENKTDGFQYRELWTHAYFIVSQKIVFFYMWLLCLVYHFTPTSVDQELAIQEHLLRNVNEVYDLFSMSRYPLLYY